MLRVDASDVLLGLLDYDGVVGGKDVFPETVTVPLPNLEVVTEQLLDLEVRSCVEPQWPE
jgi:hypothetical protein